MLDRLTNLLVLFTLTAALVVLAISLHTAWSTTAPWEKEWVAKSGAQPTYSVEKVLTAIRNATASHAYEDAQKLENILEREFVPTGKILVNVSWFELSELAITVFSVLLILVIPLSLNYVRHSKFKIWNRGS